MSLPSPRTADAVSIGALARLVERSRRNSGLQLPHTFARGTTAKRAPLARMIQGRRGAEVRLKLYLSTALLAGSGNQHPIYGPHSVFNVSGPAWARALCLGDPDRGGARRVAEAQNWLSRENLIAVDRRPGQEPVVRLRSADGDDRAWRRPTAPYLSIPLGLWEHHWIWILDARELAVFVSLLDLQFGRTIAGVSGPQWLSSDDRGRYGLSPDSWRVASQRLEQLGLVETAMRDDLARDFETRRKRKTYRVLVDRLRDEALDVAATGWTRS